MVEQQYIAPGLPHSDGLSGVPSLHDPLSTTATPPYHDLVSYSSVSACLLPRVAEVAVLSSSAAACAIYGHEAHISSVQVPSPFNSIPGQCDPNLLTPISVVGSPPLHGVSKFVHQYPPPPSTPNQQPTPPGSSKMYHQQWPGQFDVNGQSPQPSSPMAPQPPVAGDFLHNSYVHEGRRTPVPPEPYMGAFGVSNGPEPQSMAQDYYVNMPPPVNHQDHMMIRDNHHIPSGIHHRELPPAPLLSEPHPAQYRQRRPSSDDPGLHGLPADVPRSVTSSPRRRSALQAPGRVKKRQSKRSGTSRTATAEDPVSEHRNCFGQEVPPTLKPTCPDEERCIFESRWRHRYQKGQDMWESIQKDFEDRFQKRPDKETLQMKFKRGRAKYLAWLTKDVSGFSSSSPKPNANHIQDEILAEAWKSVEKDRYQIILDRYIEMGGSRNMRLNASDIEIKVVNDLKLEEGLYMESHADANIRRRRKSTSTRKRSGRGVDNIDIPANDEMMSVGSHSRHEDDVINQVYGPPPPNFKVEDDGPGGQHSMMDMHQIWDQQIKIEPGVIPHRNDRMQPMMRTSPASQTMYGERRGS
ncbi:hypothetical protein F66182_10014 [Fusarium sp. NRRL 66182]|nr:hypothetical protein F66182_10014 [Fusarium sp. NRRL 66182]